MGAVRSLWLRWKMLRLPWRRKFFVGQDLQGNTFWEFRDPLNPNRMRRMVDQSPYASRDLHYTELQLSPQWHQWLRQTRIDVPSIEEQQSDILRQSQLKINARLADERWNAKARYIEKPKTTPAPTQQQQEQQQQQPPLPKHDGVLRGDVRIDAAHAQVEEAQGAPPKPGMKSAVENPVEVPDPKKQETASAKQPVGTNPGGNYQPESWTPSGGKRNR